MDLSLIGSLAAFAISSNISPGPNNTMLMASGAHFGLRKSLPHILGVALGFPFMVLAVGLGLSAILLRFPLIHEIIRWLGIAYLLWMAWAIATAHAKKTAAGGARKPVHFLQAVLFQWVNPKAWTMAVGAITAYTAPHGDMLHDVLLIAFIFFLVGMPSAFAWNISGKSLARFLSSPERQKMFNYGMAALLIASVIPIILEAL